MILNSDLGFIWERALLYSDFWGDGFRGLSFLSGVESFRIRWAGDTNKTVV